MTIVTLLGTKTFVCCVPLAQLKTRSKISTPTSGASHTFIFFHRASKLATFLWGGMTQHSGRHDRRSGRLNLPALLRRPCTCLARVCFQQFSGFESQVESAQLTFHSLLPEKKGFWFLIMSRDVTVPTFFTSYSC